MNMAMKRAYVILEAELAKFKMGNRPHIVHYAGKVITSSLDQYSRPYPSSEDSSFLSEVQKILHLTDISIDDMDEVLEALYIKWRDLVES